MLDRDSRVLLLFLLLGLFGWTCNFFFLLGDIASSLKEAVGLCVLWGQGWQAAGGQERFFVGSSGYINVSFPFLWFFIYLLFHGSDVDFGPFFPLYWVEGKWQFVFHWMAVGASLNIWIVAVLSFHSISDKWTCMF